MCPLAGMLFHRVILMSGSALSSWARASAPHNTSRSALPSLVLKLQTIIRQCFHYHGEGRNVLNLKALEGAQVGSFVIFEI